MKLQRKTLIILALTVVGMILAIYLILSGIMTESYKELEIQTSIQNSKRVNNALYSKIDGINTLAVDWAKWDDTYEFIVDRNKDYIKSNLVETTFVDNELNVILYYNKQNQIVWGKGYDLGNEEFIEVPDSLKKYITDHTNHLLDQEDIESNVKGMVLLPEGPMMLCSSTILKSDHVGPVRGRLFFGRFLDSIEVEKLSDLTNFNIAINRVDEKIPDPEFAKVANSFTTLSDTVIEPISPDNILAFTQIKDVSDKPILVMKINMPRSIYKQGQETIKYFLILLFIIGLVFSFITIFLLERLVLSRIYKLTSAVDQIGSFTDFSGRVSVEGRDELSDLGSHINTMLEKLDESQLQLKDAKERVEERTQELQTLNKTLENEVNTRSQTEKELKENLESLSKKNKYETIIRTVTQSVHQSINLSEVMEHAVISMHENIDLIKHVAIYLKEDDLAVMKSYRGYPDWFINKVSKIPYPKGFTWKTIIDGEPRYCPDIDKDNVIGPAGRNVGSKSYLSTPIKNESNTVGTINVHSQQIDAFDDDLKLLQIVASQIEIAINNAKQAEALRQSEERYKALFDQSPVGVIHLR